ncbi:MAG TPA: adenylyl-sulfate kinase [Acidimicrobiales bacterium]|nr:adenylyl-sulfate kinase [Acidimicrobiales bacterium]
MTGAVVWLTGLPSAGKSTIAAALAARLTGDGRAVEVLDGDVVRAELCADLGYSRADRNENVRRIGYVADLLAGHGVVAICPVVSPYRSARDSVRERVGAAFVEVWVSTPVEVCAERDVKGLYARQRAGAVTGLTGVDDPYEPPVAPEVVIPGHELTVDDAVDWIVKVLP